MENIQEIKGLLQDAVNVLYKSEKWEEGAILVAQKIGLEGTKRCLRYSSAKSHNSINFVLTDTYDTLGISLTRTHFDVTVPQIAQPKEFMINYLHFITDKYNKLHTIANKLVLQNYQYGACHLYDICKCIIEDMKDCRREILEGDACGWDMAFIMYRENTRESKHDKYECKEKEVGYPT